MKEKLKFGVGVKGSAWLFEGNTRNGRHPMHRHSELEFNLVVSGRANYVVAGKRVALAPHVLLWLFPGQEHLLLDWSSDFSLWIGVFRQSLVREFCNSRDAGSLRRNDPGLCLSRLLVPGESRRLAWLCESLSIAADTLWYNAALGHVLRSAWHFYSLANDEPASSTLHPAVARAAAVLQEPGKIAGLDGISRKAGASKHHLCRLFKEQTGITMVEYRNRILVERFLYLVGTGPRVDILSAAFEAGFGSYPQFHRVFKAQTGETPAAYLRSRRGWA